MPNEPYDNGGLVTGVQMVTNNTGHPITVVPFAKVMEEGAKFLELLELLHGDFCGSDDDD